eukprot:1148924-Pelagomonas_calceolata.AAC.2
MGDRSAEKADKRDSAGYIKGSVHAYSIVNRYTGIISIPYSSMRRPGDMTSLTPQLPCSSMCGPGGTPDGAATRAATVG